MTKSKTTQSTAVAVQTAEEQAYLASLDTNRPKAEYTGPAKLVINTLSKDADGNKRTIGSWHIANTDIYYDGVAKFRPIRHANKLIRYKENSAKEWELVGQSVYFDNFMGDIPDSTGGMALGRKFGRKYSDEEKAATRDNAETYLDIFGFVSFDGGEDHPVLYRVRGTKLMKFLDAFKAVPKGTRYSQYSYDLETFQPDGKQYWDVSIAPDMSQVLPIMPILEYDAAVLEYIKSSNEEVMTSYKRNSGNKFGDTMAENMKNVTPEYTDVTDDEMPF